MRMKKVMDTVRRSTVAGLLVSFLTGSFVPPAMAADVMSLMPVPGVMLAHSDPFIPVILKGMKFDPASPLRFDFMFDTGNTDLPESDLRNETGRSIRYFLAALTVPEDDLWVNLSPYEGDRIIARNFGLTEMGRDLLAEDYILKQFTSSLMFPKSSPGKEMWQKIYDTAYAKFGTTDIPLDVFNKVWIMPDEATVYVNGNTVFIAGSHLKVMLDIDHAALNKNAGATLGSGPGSITQQAIRQVVLPEIEKEVNFGRNFAGLRQSYHAMILATWFKRNLKRSVLGEIYSEKNMVAGIDRAEKDVQVRIWRSYVEAYAKGAFSYVSDEFDPASQTTIARKYFSGGYRHNPRAVKEMKVSSWTMADKAQEQQTGTYLLAAADLEPVRDKSKSLKMVPSQEIRQRFAALKTPGRETLMGFMRDAGNRVQPVFSNGATFQSTREITHTGWDPRREMKVLPLAALDQRNGIRLKAIHKTDDWDVLPDDLKTLLEQGSVLVTAPADQGSGYAVLMAVTPESRFRKTEGRSGVLLKDGLPIVVESDGKEFVVEIKGLGNAEGGFDPDYPFLRGGAQVSETAAELASLEMIRGARRAFGEGETVRAVADINFLVQGRLQGYLIRLSPGSVRATYNDNMAFQFEIPEAQKVEHIARDMGRQMAEYFNEGYIPASHPENLVAVNGGERFIFTDHSDIVPAHIFPMRLEGEYYYVEGIIAASLNTVSEIPGYAQYNGFKFFLEGLAGGLLEAGRITAGDKVELLGLARFEQIRDLLWKKFMAVDQYKAIKLHGKTPHIFSYLKSRVDGDVFRDLEAKASQKYKTNQQEIERFRRRILQASGEVDNDQTYAKVQVAALEEQNRLLEKTGFTAKGIIEVTDSPEARASFRPVMLDHRHVSPSSAAYFVIWDLWGSILSDLGSVGLYLEQEVEFLGTVAASADAGLLPDVQKDLEIARERSAAVSQMSPYDLYQKLLVDPAYPKTVSMLPYLSATSDGAQELGGIDMNARHLRLNEKDGPLDMARGQDAAMLRKKGIHGFSPVIGSITPMKDIQAFFGAVKASGR